MPTDEPAWSEETLADPHGVPDKAPRIRRMFNAISPRYQLVNTVFSAGRDAKWRRQAVRLADVHDSDVVLDVACGTGDLARVFASACARMVIGVDFAHEMLIRAANPDGFGTARAMRGHATRQGTTSLHWCEADALCLPFRTATFTIVSCAFGVRNFENLDAGLAEMCRVLRGGGRAVILEFSRPQKRLIRGLYEFYANRLMPQAATWVSGDRSGAYRYLPRSVVSFPEPEEMVARLHGAGFAHTQVVPLTMGIVTVYVARKPS